MRKIWVWVNGNKTMIGVVLSVVVSVLSRRGVEVPTWIFDITDGVLGLGLAHKAVKAVGAKTVGTVAALLCAVSCAAPKSDQGQGQGGSTGATPQSLVVINIGTGGGVSTSTTSAPTAAPAATSAAQSSQTATTDTQPNLSVGTDAIKAVVPAVVPVIGGDGTVSPPR
jgi:hypothetical protein